MDCNENSAGGVCPLPCDVVACLWVEPSAGIQVLRLAISPTICCCSWALAENSHASLMLGITPNLTLCPSVQGFHGKRCGSCQSDALPQQHGPVQMRIMLDHSCVEIFMASGEVLSTRIYRGSIPIEEVCHCCTADRITAGEQSQTRVCVHKRTQVYSYLGLVLPRARTAATCSQLAPVALHLRSLQAKLLLAH